MDPHEFVEKILTGQKPKLEEIDSGFDITEILDEVATVDHALEELEQAVASLEDGVCFEKERIDIDQGLQEERYMANLENQFHI